MHCLSQRKARFWRKVRRHLYGRLGHCHIIQQLVHCPLLQSWQQFLMHLQLAGSGVALIDQQFWLVLHQVDK